MFVDIACSDVVGTLAFMALNMWTGVKWQVGARKRSWLTLRKCPTIHMM